MIPFRVGLSTAARRRVDEDEAGEKGAWKGFLVEIMNFPSRSETPKPLPNSLARFPPRRRDCYNPRRSVQPVCAGPEGRITVSCGLVECRGYGCLDEYRERPWSGTGRTVGSGIPSRHGGLSRNGPLFSSPGSGRWS